MVPATGDVAVVGVPRDPAGKRHLCVSSVSPDLVFQDVLTKQGRKPNPRPFLAADTKEAVLDGHRVAVRLPAERRLAVEEQDPALGDLLRRERVGPLLLAGGAACCHEYEKDRKGAGHGTDLRF